MHPGARDQRGDDVVVIIDLDLEKRFRIVERHRLDRRAG
jgi:hypothetical protein